MPVVNEFIIFDETRQNTLTQEEYENSMDRMNGVSSGISRSKLYNKAMHQVSIVSNAIGRAMNEEGDKHMN